MYIFTYFTYIVHNICIFIHLYSVVLTGNYRICQWQLLRMQSNKNSPVSGMINFTGESCFLFLSFFPAGPFCSSTIPLNVVARLASPCRSDGTTIFVAFPFARTPSASRLFKVRTASSAPASLMARIPSAFACCTLRIASAWPSASRIRFSFSASARRIAACFSASASRIADCFYLRQPGWSIFHLLQSGLLHGVHALLSSVSPWLPEWLPEA